MNKKNFWKSAVLAGLVVVAAACSEDEPTPAINNDEAAELIGASLTVNSGLLAIVNQSAVAADAAVAASSSGRQAACEYSDEADFEISSDPGTTPSFAYVFSYDFLLQCDGETATSLNVNATYSIEYDGPNAAFDFDGTSALSVSELQESSADYVLNGDFDRSGSYEWKQDNPSAGTSEIGITIEELVVNKESQRIVEGTATVNLSGSVTGKGSYSYSATVEFNGDGTADLTVNNAAYIVNLTSGVVTKG